MRLLQFGLLGRRLARGLGAVADGPADAGVTLQALGEGLLLQGSALAKLEPGKEKKVGF